MPFTGLRRLFNFKTKLRSRSQQNPKRSQRPWVELLEVRELLATATWTGLSTTSNNWSDGNNWSVGPTGQHIAPTTNDDLVFPALTGTTPRLNPNNDLAGLTVGSIAISGSGYNINVN